MEKVAGNEIVKNMEHLVKLLHKEWERSGRTKETVVIDIVAGKAVGSKIAEKIQKSQERLEREGLNFKQSMKLSKENFVLLRLAKKIKKAGDKAKHPENDTTFTVKMDKEEYRLFSMLVQAEEV